MQLSILKKYIYFTDRRKYAKQPIGVASVHQKLSQTAKFSRN